MAVNEPSSKAQTQARAQDLLGYGQRQVDRIVSPSTRQKAYNSTSAYASDRPLLFSFFLVQLLFSFLPLLLFVGFALSTATVAFASAVAFSLFWIGIASLFLIPTLFITSSIASLVFLWALTTFLAGRWVYNVLPVSVRGDARLNLPNGKQVIIEKPQRNGVGFDIKTEAAEFKD
ncbi:Uu.00g133280.m01.CDS01 [Anthostomella pinea]|uniref:Uu.00g133280.m01.CDS01 n=1 Tax=Anthostomella pinea TaxID=933095 RepID=A0AAI8YMP4_9PEZI|nr:Uu.00g133280.m01.CDS01 [Anthostomella pinea]